MLYSQQPCTVCLKFHTIEIFAGGIQEINIVLQNIYFFNTNCKCHNTVCAMQRNQTDFKMALQRDGKVCFSFFFSFLSCFWSSLTATKYKLILFQAFRSSISFVHYWKTSTAYSKIRYFPSVCIPYFVTFCHHEHTTY